MIGVPTFREINKTVEKEDMTVHHNSSPSKKIIQIDIDKEFENEESCNEIQVNDEESDRYGTIMKQIAINYTDIQGAEGSVYSSDYCPLKPVVM